MKMLLNGEWVDRNQKIEVRDPQDGRLIDVVPAGSIEDMNAAIEAAQAGFISAKSLPTHKRRAILLDAAQSIKQNHEDFAQTIASEGIKTIREARKEVTRCIETLTISAEATRNLTGETILFDQMPGSENRRGFFTREPIGIIGAITPFNDPLNLVAHKVGPAIAAGNAIIVKPDSRTPLSALKLAKAIQDAGAPAGIIQVITGSGQVIGSALAADRRVRMISFTGGVETGENIMRLVGLKKVSMELGNNAPVIVMADADLEKAIEANVSGAFWAAGQNCLHVQRLFVQNAIYEPFVEGMVSATQRYIVGDKMNEATDMGSMINEAAAIRVEEMVTEALEGGAELLTGGTREGSFYYPTLLQNLPADCELARTEVYGPVTIIYRFNELDDAIRRANAVEYGLQAGIFTTNLSNAFYAAENLDSGGIIVNDSTDYRIDAMPFGGSKNSGLGREGVQFAIHEMTDPKLVCFNL